MPNVIIYTDTNMPDLPAQMGMWARIDRIAPEGSRVTFRVTYENPVGGTVAYRFATMRAANKYVGLLFGLPTPKGAYLAQGRTIFA
jgi:hypothetical protein